ncbi:hypothetical protein BIZ94_gp043 [Pseudomonas phage vB_PaeM_MAG1]|uniref:Uncharacterized protein n=1 Tax=Pseudomonas phage vB_PaeM_MAG1 TaxID=1639815 RepID=A0A172EK27_9CAUD|nr:hypothetical protein BIZ94_gp043 [Pseudomonas phage vB_PaeM_MAG1]ALA12023.1 hypothetical protein vB_PaeM_MAG1_043 [Pseudomonas phage vB_PaeM_MAG1]
MNGAQKFHSPDGPAFSRGEVWVSCEGFEVEILEAERYGPRKWDVSVYYVQRLWKDANDAVFVKDAWNFQVRYQHQSDKEI